jgi:hypothetical protein
MWMLVLAVLAGAALLATVMRSSVDDVAHRGPTTEPRETVGTRIAP